MSKCPLCGGLLIAIEDDFQTFTIVCEDCFMEYSAVLDEEEDDEDLSELLKEFDEADNTD